MSVKCTCRHCNRTYIYDRKKGHRKTICNSCNVVTARQRLKRKAVEYKGGCCQICGYNNYQGSLDFHHLEPGKKDFSIGSNGLYRNWLKIKNELDKCILVCKNCHGEIHAGLINPLIL